VAAEVCCARGVSILDAASSEAGCEQEMFQGSAGGGFNQEAPMETC